MTSLPYRVLLWLLVLKYVAITTIETEDNDPHWELSIDLNNVISGVVETEFPHFLEQIIYKGFPIFI